MFAHMESYQSAIPLFKALCDETRLRILGMLSQSPMNGCEIHRAFACTQPTISYHMKLLVDAHLVCAHKEGCCMIYRLNQDLWPRVQALLAALDDDGKEGEAHE